jgi:membrane peptidoglycan carboxypeptidase
VLNKKGDPRAALVAIDPKTGAVRAMYGGSNQANQPFDYATDALRQAGSTMKPFVLEEALNEGYSVNSVFRGPNKLTVQGEEYSNFGRENYGDITLMDATRQSVNTVYVQLAEKVGPRKVAELSLRTGLADAVRNGEKPNELYDPQDKNPNLTSPVVALGPASVSTLQLASAYGTWANQGIHNPAYLVEKVTDSSGQLVERHQSRATPIVQPNIANTITAALRGVVDSGTATAARLPDREVAGKTGTTSNSRDARFVGYDSNLVTSVWVGYENKPGQKPRPLVHIHGIKEVTGGSLPAVIWHNFMLEATRNLPPQPFPQPTFGGLVLNSTTTSATTTTATTVAPPPTDTQPQRTLPPQTTQPPAPSSTARRPPCCKAPARRTRARSRCARLIRSIAGKPWPCVAQPPSRPLGNAPSHAGLRGG